MRPFLRVFFAALLSAVLAPEPGRTSNEGGPSLAEQSLAECTAGRESRDRSARERHFTAGVALAERAVAANKTSPEAHFARFCNKGELARIDGESLGALIALGGLMADLDRTLELEPDHAHAMASKGIMLIRLPRMFGGDATKGEAMLRRVVEIDPTAVSSRLVLAERSEARGNHAEAVTWAKRALEIAVAQGRSDKVAEARALLAELGGAGR